MEEGDKTNRSLSQAAVTCPFIDSRIQVFLAAPVHSLCPFAWNSLLQDFCIVGLFAGLSPQTALPRPCSPMLLYFPSSLWASTLFSCLYGPQCFHKIPYLLFIVSLFPYWNVKSVTAQILLFLPATVSPLSRTASDTQQIITIG